VPVKLRNLPKAIMAACGSNFSAVVCENGSLWTWGLDLGTGHARVETMPTEIPQQTFSSAVAMIACGSTHAVALTVTGRVWTCGNGDDGALGHGDQESMAAFKRLEPLTPFVCTMVATGDFHSIVLQDDGTMWTFGAGLRGQLGHGRYQSRNTPQRVAGDFCDEGETVEMITAGGAHSAAITTAGSLWTWGSGVCGELGVERVWGLRMDKCNPHHVTMPHSVGTDLSNQVLSISCGPFHSLILKRNGSLWGCGQNTNFEIEPRSMTGHRQELDYVFTPLALGANFATTKFASVYATFHASSAVDDQGRVWHWGDGILSGVDFPGVGGIIIRRLGKRIGRCHDLPEEHALALCMQGVERLSLRDDTPARHMRDCIDNGCVLRHIVLPMCKKWPEGEAGRRLRGMPGLLRLLGGLLVRHGFM